MRAKSCRLVLVAVVAASALGGAWSPGHAAGVEASTVAAAASSSSGEGSGALLGTRREDPQAQLDRAMSRQPGGVQVSDNAVVWGDGDVVMVVPHRGERKAPAGLGDNVREWRLTSPALRELAVVPSDRSTKRSEAPSAFDVNGCPSGLDEKDYYCFYQYRSWGGRRVQFTGDTKSSDAADWGFDNGTTSWVSTDVDCTVRAYNARRPRDLGNYMWRQPENSRSSYVGSTNDNKMSFWTCNGDG